MSTKKLYEGILIFLSIVLLITAGFSFYKVIELNTKKSVVIVEEKPSVTIDEYKYYKFDNLSFGFIVATVEGKGIVDSISIEDSMTSENTRYGSFVSFLDTMRGVGYKSNHISSVNVLKNGFNELFLVVTDPNLKEYELSVNNEIKLTFDLSNPISDKTIFGFVVDPDEENEQPNNKPPVDSGDPSTPIDVREHESLKLDNLVEVNLGSVFVLEGSKYVEMGYPSNTRVFVVPVTILKPGTVITSASLKLVGVDATFTAIPEKLKLETSGKLNILNNGELTSGLLFFEINGAEYEVTTFSYNLDFTIEGE